MIKQTKFLDTFDVNPEPGQWFVQYKTGGPFLCQKERMHEHQLQSHLDGRYWIACRPTNTNPKWVIVDIDNHYGVLSEAQLNARCDLVTLALNMKAYVWPSPRNGRHLYFWTDLGRSTAELYCSTKLILERAGIMDEVYPRPGLCFRLPFGKGQAHHSIFNRVYKETVQAD